MLKEKITLKVSISPYNSIETTINFTEDALESNELTSTEVATLGSILGKTVHDAIKEMKGRRASNLEKTLDRKRQHEENKELLVILNKVNSPMPGGVS